MKAVLTQLFFVPEFRSAILGWIAERGDEPLEPGAVSQLRNYFAFMQQSENYDGPLVRTSEGTDANEYLELLFDELEAMLSDTDHKHLLRECFMGKLESQLVCREEVCVRGEVYPVDEPFMSTREEAFFTLSLNIKGMKTLCEALAGFVEGEMLDGDNKFLVAEGCAVEAEKRACIKALPRTLFLHLRRYEFDFMTGRSIKINDRCELPLKLNMEPYTAAGIERREKLAAVARREGTDPAAALASLDLPADAEYELVGAVVHAGSARMGCYYSYVQNLGAGGEVRGRWEEHREGKVSEFDVDGLDAACFGGDGKSHSAYILVYRKSNDAVTLLGEQLGGLSVGAAPPQDLAEELANLRV